MKEKIFAVITREPMTDASFLVIPACPESASIRQLAENDSRRAACGGLAGMTVWVV